MSDFNQKMKKCDIHILTLFKGPDGSLKCAACEIDKKKQQKSLNIVIGAPAKYEDVKEQWTKSTEEFKLSQISVKAQIARVSYAKTKARKELNYRQIKKLSEDELLSKFNPKGLPMSLKEEAEYKKKRVRENILKKEKEARKKEAIEYAIEHGNLIPGTYVKADLVGYPTVETGLAQGFAVLLMSPDELKHYRQTRKDIIKKFVKTGNPAVYAKLPLWDKYRIIYEASQKRLREEEEEVSAADEEIELTSELPVEG